LKPYSLEEAQRAARANRGECGSNHWPIKFDANSFQEWREGIERKLSFKEMQAILSQWRFNGF